MSGSIRAIADAAKSAFLGGAGEGPLAPGDLATWELRGRLVATLGGAPRVDLDGGLRLDFAGGDARWVVGADPGPGGPGWSELADRFAGALRDALPEAELAAARVAAAWAEGGRELEETRVELRARLAIRAPGEPALLVEEGGEVRLRWRDRAGPGTTTLALEDASTAAPPAARPVPGTFASIGESDFRVILAPEAAAYCLHELAHAALERGGDPAREPGAEGPALVEDPAAAPFPYGFVSDALGRRAARSTLWSTTGRHRMGDGHARRSTLADPPRASLSYTRLVGAARVPERDGAPSLYADRVSAARYDTALDRIFLAVPSPLIVESTGRARVAPGGVLVASAEEAWRGLGEVVGEGQQRLVRARCTRLGCVHPVMVGAPTIALRSMQFLPGFPRQAREGA